MTRRPVGDAGRRRRRRHHPLHLVEVDARHALDQRSQVAAADQAIVVGGRVLELRHQVRHRREDVAGRVDGRVAAGDGVAHDHAAREVGGDRRIADADAVAEDAVVVVLDDVAGEAEAGRHPRRGGRAAVDRDDVAAVDHRVVLDVDVGRLVADLQEDAGAAPGAVIDVGEQVVADDQVAQLAAGESVVVAEDVDGRAGVPHDVVLEADVFDRRPRRGRAVRTHGEQDREARLSARPVVLDQVAVDLDEAGVLELEQIFHDPRSGTPRDGPGDVVAADDDVARDQLIDGRRGAAEQDADPGRLDVVVLDDEGARPVPARDPL